MNIEDCSYDTMTEIRSKWYPVSKRALEHNCEVTSSLLHMWAEMQITVGTRSEWLKACRKVKMDKCLKGKSKIWGSYSPKLYDGDIIIAASKTIDNDFPDNKILADNRFAQANNYFKKGDVLS